MTVRQFWAMRRRKRVGPFATRDEALAAFRLAYPFKGESYEAKARRNAIMTGYGAEGPHLDIQWHYATDDAEAAQ